MTVSESQLLPILAEVSRLERITVCTRPFRAAGPRLERQELAGKILVHNYGHGGSGWSLSWGSAAQVTSLLQGELPCDVAVIGCGAIGLTTALLLQRAGARVRILARELPPQVRSSRATGSWTPDARIALASEVDAAFASAWEQMARASFHEYSKLLELPGEPVKVLPRYLLSAVEPEQALQQRMQEDPIGFAHLEARIADLWPEPVDLGVDASPFPGLHARRSLLFRFDITALSQLLMKSFVDAGGVLEERAFADLADVVSVREPVIVNCTGYGARALLGDESVIPIRGQISWLPAQPEVEYSLQWENLNVVARPDGIVVQLGAGGDGAGWQDDSEIADPEEADYAVRRLAHLQTAPHHDMLPANVETMELVDR